MDGSGMHELMSNMKLDSLDTVTPSLGYVLLNVEEPKICYSAISKVYLSFFTGYYGAKGWVHCSLSREGLWGSEKNTDLEFEA